MEPENLMQYPILIVSLSEMTYSYSFNVLTQTIHFYFCRCVLSNCLGKASIICGRSDSQIMNKTGFWLDDRYFYKILGTKRHSSGGHSCNQHVNCKRSQNLQHPCCVIKLHILKWPFIVARLRHTCGLIILSNRHRWNMESWNISAKI